MPLKDTISSPLEAGPSLLDAHHIPPQLVPALEYTSSRLARKSLHLTLVVARRDYQLPPSPVLCSPPPSPPSTCGSPASPSRSRSFTRHLHLPRWGRRRHHDHQPSPSPTSPSLSSSSAASSMPTSPRSIFSLPAYTPISPQFPRSQQGSMSPKSPIWPLTPMTPLSPRLPTTPSTMKSSVPTESSSSYGFPMTPQHGVRLIHHGNLPAKAERTLQSALAKAGRKSGGDGRTHIAPALGAPACGLSSALFNDSVAQNDVLFSSDGLSLIALDRLYSLKAALSSYSKTGSPLRLEDAVDELRRYVLATGDKVSKMHLLRSYDSLNVSRSALADLDRMYRRAYGGVEMQGGIDGMYFAPVPETTSSVWSDDEEDDDEDEEDDDDEMGREGAYNDQDSGVYVEGLPDSPTIDPATVGMSDSATPVPTQPKPSPSSASSASSRKSPPLRVQTSMIHTPAHQTVDKTHAIDERQNATPIVPQEEEEEEEKEAEAVATARPDDESGLAAVARDQLWCSTQSASIDEVLSPGADPETPARDRNDDDDDGPMTPNGYDDISPITRGEWGFLLVDRDFRNARTVAVTTC
ncbi:hypothetical protein MY4038_005085 [Beauveria bassiana]